MILLKKNEKYNIYEEEVKYIDYGNNIILNKGVLRLYGGQIQKTMKYWGKYDYTSSGWASRAAQIRMVCSA